MAWGRAKLSLWQLLIVEGSVKTCFIWLNANQADVALAREKTMRYTLVSDGLWECLEPVLSAQRERPQGGGTPIHPSMTPEYSPRSSTR